MPATERDVYDATALAAELIHYLSDQAALAVDEQTAAAKALDFFDERAPRAAWPEDWREHAHINLLDLAG
jgi:hypothetical protein